MNPDFVDLLRAFIAADVRFLIVGAYALALHGRRRATGDLDVDFIGRAAFIRNKRAIGRAKDRRHRRDVNSVRHGRTPRA
jgi:hypothetical protein